MSVQLNAVAAGIRKHPVYFFWLGRSILQFKGKESAERKAKSVAKAAERMRWLAGLHTAEDHKNRYNVEDYRDAIRAITRVKVR